MTPPTVLFLCTANSARSQMAEAILRHLAPDRFTARSAGLAPTTIHPLTLQVLAEAGIDTTGLHAKGTREFLGRASIRHAVIVCDRANQHCPTIQPFALRTHYWPFPDPAAAPASEQLDAFRAVRGQIDDRIRQWLASPESGP